MRSSRLGAAGPLDGCVGVHADGVDGPIDADPAGQPPEGLDGMLRVEVDRLGALARAISSRDGTVSMAKTRPAPSSRAETMANRPTGPQPKTATVSPGVISAMSAPK